MAPSGVKSKYQIRGKIEENPLGTNLIGSNNLSITVTTNLKNGLSHTLLMSETEDKLLTAQT